VETSHIEEYYKHYGPMVLRRCRFLLRDEEQALDAMQDVFVRLLARRENLRHQFPSSLLFRIATNVCLNMLRAGRKTPLNARDDLLMQIASFDEHEKRFMFVHQQKSSSREIAVMRFLYGMTLEEVAAETGFSVSGVRKRIRQLQQQCRAHGGKEVFHVY
jgi:RNA polymerase sigma-70 factor (ECF subfamily)